MHGWCRPLGRLSGRKAAGSRHQAEHEASGRPRPGLRRCVHAGPAPDARSDAMVHRWCRRGGGGLAHRAAAAVEPCAAAARWCRRRAVDQPPSQGPRSIRVAMSRPHPLPQDRRGPRTLRARWRVRHRDQVDRRGNYGRAGIPQGNGRQGYRAGARWPEEDRRSPQGTWRGRPRDTNPRHVGVRDRRAGDDVPELRCPSPARPSRGTVAQAASHRRQADRTKYVADDRESASGADSVRGGRERCVGSAGSTGSTGLSTDLAAPSMTWRYA